MILTISSQDTDLCDAIAVALANRRADAGRNVLLLCQKMLSRAATDRCDRESARPTQSAMNPCWTATEMKAGAKSRELPDHQVINELRSALNQYRDIVIDMPSFYDTDALSLLASSDLLLLVIPVARWNYIRQDDLIEQIRAARRCQCSLPILIVIDEQTSSAGQTLSETLKAQIPHLKIFALSRISEMSIAELYRSIYWERTLMAMV